MRWMILLTAVVWTLLFQSAWAAMPHTMSFQGSAKSVDGAPLDGDHVFTFRIYDTDDPGVTTPLWEETQTLTVNGGIFNAILGKLTVLNLPFDDPYWLGVSIDGGDELDPRTTLAASPYALRADIANSVVGGTADSDWIVDGDDMYAGVGGNVGIGVSDPEVKLAVAGADDEDLLGFHVGGAERFSMIAHASGTDYLGIRYRLSDPDLDIVVFDQYGRVGVGTLEPNGPLQIESDININTGSNFDNRVGALVVGDGDGSERCLLIDGNQIEQAWGIEPLYLNYNSPSPIIMAMGGGGVGIGTSTPDERLEVVGTIKAEGLQVTTSPTAGHVLTADANGYASWQPPGEFTLPYSGWTTEPGGPAFHVDNRTTGAGIEGQSSSGDGVYGHTSDDVPPFLHAGVVGKHGISENVGELGTRQAGVYGQYGVDGPIGKLGIYSAGVAGVNLAANTQGALATEDYGVHGIGDSHFEGGTFTVNGDAVFSNGTVTVPVLEIIGGSDLSEQFEIGDKGKRTSVSPGMVVSIDPQSPGALQVSDRAYDRTVAGVVSGAGGVEPGMLMGQQGSVADGTTPVALTGRVYCWVDADFGAVEPGDLLTTSNTPGHAMKAAELSRAQGAILGKALTSLGQGKGLVLILVTLQ